MSTNLNRLENVNNINLNLLDDILLPEVEKKVENPNEDKYIIHSQQVDTKTIKRTRVKITPAVCDICGFDVAKLAYTQNKLSTDIFDDLTEEIQNILKQAILKHKQITHSAADNLIVSESQKPKRWLISRDV